MPITNIFNAIISTGHFPNQRKVSQIILIPKPRKSDEEVPSHKPMRLLPMLSKILEKLSLARLKPQLEKLIPQINNTFESKKYRSAAFLDITQAFDKVSHHEPLSKLKVQLPAPIYKVLQSYLTKRYFMVKQNEEVTDLYPILSGVS